MRSGAFVIPNANHFHHADYSDHSTNAMSSIHGVSTNILTIYVKLHFKLYKICYMQGLVLDPYYTKFPYDFMGQIFKENPGWCHARW